MRKWVVFLHMSLDGIVEGPNGAMDISFVQYNHELEEFANQVTAKADTILWERSTYERMYHYWPNMLGNLEASEHERNHAAWVASVDKLVCSTSLSEVTWNNASLIKDNLIQCLHNEMAKDGGAILVLGSPRLAQFLLKEGVVDQLCLTVSPVIVGAGLNLFNGISGTLKLLESVQMQSGVLGLTYTITKVE
ncbi:TPA: dihydrofolate reductase family protein [Streptococcus suis]|nr:dihydrofolate reductase family protein [Streptococcus suis]